MQVGIVPWAGFSRGGEKKADDEEECDTKTKDNNPERVLVGDLWQSRGISGTKHVVLDFMKQPLIIVER